MQRALHLFFKVFLGMRVALIFKICDEGRLPARGAAFYNDIRNVGPAVMQSDGRVISVAADKKVLGASAREILQRPSVSALSIKPRATQYSLNA